MKTWKQRTFAAIATIALFFGFMACSRIDDNYAFCSTQQITRHANMPVIIYGDFDAHCAETYRIQVGPPSDHSKACNTMMRLQGQNLNPVREISCQYSRVVLRGISADQVIKILSIIKRAGFNKVWIQPDTQDEFSTICQQPISQPTIQQGNNCNIEAAMPPVPRNVSAGTPEADSVTISWDSAGSGISYKLYYSTRNDLSCAVAMGKPVTVAAAKINGLSSGMNYYFWVTSVRNNRESEKSSVVSIKTARCVP